MYILDSAFNVIDSNCIPSKDIFFDFPNIGILGSYMYVNFQLNRTDKLFFQLMSCCVISVVISGVIDIVNSCYNSQLYEN